MQRNTFRGHQPLIAATAPHGQTKTPCACLGEDQGVQVVL